MKKVLTLIFITCLFQPLYAQENEPNDDPGSANISLLGDTLVGTISPSDIADYFELEIPEGGLLHLDVQREPEFSAEWWIIIVDAESNGYPEITKANFYWNTGIKSMSLHVLAGKYFIKIGQAAGEVKYRVYPTLTPPILAEDMENNDIPDSSLMWDGNTLLTGNIRYYNPGIGIDNEDWYRFELDSPSRLHLDITDDPESWTYWWLYLLDGEQEGYPVVGQADLYWNSGINSLTTALLEGTYYIKIGDAQGVVNYHVEPTHTPPAWPGDIEPNNEFATATDLPLNDTITGLLKYYDPGIGRDLEDWYQIEVDESGLLKMDIYNAVDNANFWVYLKDGNEEGTPAIQSIQFYWLDGNKHKNIVQRLDSGTYYLQFANADRDFSYQIVSEYFKDPVADFEYAQVNNSVLFENLSLHGIEYLWEFGDENQSVAVNPFHEYDEPGVYDICLAVFNEAGKDTICQQVIVEGIAAVYPNSGGNTGDVTLTVFGGGLDSNSMIIIENMGDQLYFQDTIIQTGRDAIRGRLDLRGKPIGLYDIVVETASGIKYVLKEAFTIEQGTRPDPWVEVSGRDRILFNTPSTYTVRYGNNGNVDASVVNIWLAFSDVPDMKIEFTGAAFISPEENLDSIIIDENPDPGILYFTTDSVLGEPFQARVYPLIIPSITANTVEEFEIKIKTSKNIRIQSWANEAAFQSPFNKKTALCIAAIFTENFTSALPQLTNDEIECLLDTYAESFNIFYKLGKLTAMSEEYGIKVVKIYYNRLRTLDKKTLVPQIRGIRNLLRTCTSLPPQSSEEAGRIVTNILVGQLLTKEESLEVCLEPSCADSAKSSTRSNNDDCPECGTYCPLNVCGRTITAVSSFDPNEKDQPQGYTLDNFTFYRKTLPYNIHFENVDSATAPAHTVRVVDVLDVDKFKLSSFQFGSVTIADTTVTPEKGSYQMLMDIDLNNLNVVARVEASIDTLSGKVEWVFRSLDPVTLEEIEDPDVGFLPPNVSKPEGQGRVSFFIDLKENLVNGDEVVNDAQIFFDANDPIFTNISSFILDLGLPESTVDPLDVKTSDTLFQIQWSGNDDESGVRFYDIYVSEDDGEFERWRSRTSLTSDYFKGIDGKSYRFFSVAIDSVGNEEGFPDSWDAETFISTSTKDQFIPVNAINIFPNPCYGSLTLDIDQKLRIQQWSITNAIGTKLMHNRSKPFPSIDHLSNINLSHLPGGIYFIQIQMNDQWATRKFILINE